MLKDVRAILSSTAQWWCGYIIIYCTQCIYWCIYKACSMMDADHSVRVAWPGHGTSLLSISKGGANIEIIMLQVKAKRLNKNNLSGDFCVDQMNRYENPCTSFHTSFSGKTMDSFPKFRFEGRPRQREDDTTCKSSFVKAAATNNVVFWQQFYCPTCHCITFNFFHDAHIQYIL